VKLIVVYEEPLKGKERLFPRDIRNYIASITKGDEVHNEIMGHHRKQPTFIFSMPNRKSFCIYTFKSDENTHKMMKSIVKRVMENREIKLAGVNLMVKKAYTSPYEFSLLRSGLFERRLRSPMIIASQEFEYAICRKFSNGGVDKKALERFTREKIKETVVLMARDWFGEERAEVVSEIMEDTMIMFKELEYTPIKYKENEYYPAVRGTIICDVELPHFIGYKSGLGYGELSTLKEMDRRKKPRGGK